MSDRQIRNTVQALLALAQELADRHGCQIYLIVDRVGSDLPVDRALQQLSPAIIWRSLFAGFPEEVMEAEAPLLAQLQLQSPQHHIWLCGMLENENNKGRLLLAISPLNFATLHQQLSTLAQFNWREKSGIFRYYDSRVFAELFNNLLIEPQQQAFLRIARRWLWLDRDGQPATREGSLQPDAESLPEPSILTLSDRQIARLGYISTAEMLSRKVTNADQGTEAGFQRHLREVESAAEEGGVRPSENVPHG